MSRRIFSWNVNGIRAAVKKGFADSIETFSPDVLCLQETKAQEDQVLEALAGMDGWHIHANHAVKKGYSGTAIMSKREPLNVMRDLGNEAHDQEGRLITCEFEDYFVSSVYVPNSKHGLTRLDNRKEWDQELLAYCKKLEEKKPVLLLGDFNVAHQEIDIARPKSNYNKTPGYTQAEIDGMSAFLAGGMHDTYRELHPDTVKYSWWSMRSGAREKNIGWRLDYCLVSEALMPRVKEAEIRNDVYGSDHCPIGVQLD